MSGGEYVVGALELALVLGVLSFGASRLRRRVLPGFTGASARLAEVVLTIAMLVVVSELVGVVGLYKPGWVMLGAIAAGLGAAGWAGSPGDPELDVPSPVVKPVALALASIAALLVTAHWAMPAQVGLDIGMYLPNTTWHNAPFAARFVQDSQVGSIHFTEILRLTVWFYPQNSELLHSSGILFLRSDLLSPLLNLIWMCGCLLAAWSFGRPYGAGAAALLGVAVVADAEMLLLYQPGDAKNDVLGLFFLLSAAAILVNGDALRNARTGAVRTFHSAGPALRAELPTGVLVVAGLAAGLALGTKLNLLAPFGLLTIGVIAVAGAGKRIRTALIWSASALVTGGFWFARNLVEAGNPLPWFDKGPLPGPDQLDIDIREPHTVSDYLTNSHVIRDSFIPGLHNSFGELWPLTLAVLIGGIVVAMLRGRTPMLRMLGFVAAFSGIAYLFTPLTAAGPLNDPSAFEVNLRYGSPALALGALVLAVDPKFSREHAQRWLIGVLGVLLLVSAVPVWDLGGDLWRKKFILGAIVIPALVVAAPIGLTLLRRRGIPRAMIAGLAVVTGLLAIGAGALERDDYLADRYQADTAPSDFPAGIRSALAWFNDESPTDSRFAVVGGRPGFKQYVFYGNDLSNHVQYVADEGPHGTFRPIVNCEDWVRTLNAGDYDYLVAGPDQRTQSRSPVEAEWTGADPAATELVSDDDIFVFELNGELNPASCPDGTVKTPAAKN